MPVIEVILLSKAFYNTLVITENEQQGEPAEFSFDKSAAAQMLSLASRDDRNEREVMLSALITCNSYICEYSLGGTLFFPLRLLISS